MLAKCGHFSCSPSCTARCGAGDKSVHRGQTLARGGGSRAAALVCCLRRRVHSSRRVLLFPCYLQERGVGESQAGRSRVPGEHSETRDPGATRRIATRIHIALRAFLRWVPALVPLAQERSLHSAGTRDCRYATPERRRSWKCTTPTGLPPSTTISCVFLDDQVMRPGESLRNPDPIERDFAQMVPSSFCPARKNLFGSTASPRTRVS
jgi:hypothetical protein